MRCVIYSRVSTDAQEREGTSLDTQEAACAEHARREGWTVMAEVLRDTASGFTLERPGIERVRALAASGQVDVVLAHALDRLSRKQTHVAILVEEMEQHDVTLRFVTEDFENTATGQLLRSVKAFAAEFEREKIAERTMRGKVERARSGRLPQGTGRGMYGYVYDPSTGKRTVVAEQAKVVLRLFTEFATGCSIIGLCNALNDEGTPTFAGGQWSPATVFHLLQHEAYTGRTLYRKTKVTPRKGSRPRRVEPRDEADWIEVPGATPEVVPREMFDAVQLRLRDPERLRSGRRKWDYLLSGRVRCRECGRAMVGQTQHQKYRYYRCRAAFAGPKHDRCDSKYVRADRLEDAVRAAATAVLSRPEIVMAEIRRQSAAAGSPRNEAARTKQRLRELEAQRGRLLRLFQLGEIDEPHLRRETVLIRAEQERLAEQAPPVMATVPELPDSKGLRAMCDAIREWVNSAEGDDMNLLLDALQIRVDASRDGSELRGVIPSSAPTDVHADVCSVVINNARTAHAR